MFCTTGAAKLGDQKIRNCSQYGTVQFDTAVNYYKNKTPNLIKTSVKVRRIFDILV